MKYWIKKYFPELLVLGAIFLILWFTPTNYKLWVGIGIFVINLALLIGVYVKVWLDDTVVYNHKRFRHFTGCKDTVEADKIANQLNILGHTAMVLQKKWWTGEIVPHVYVIWAKDKQRITPYEVRNNQQEVV